MKKIVILKHTRLKILFLSLLNLLSQTKAKIQRVTNSPLCSDECKNGSIYGGTRVHIQADNIDVQNFENNSVTVGGSPCLIDNYFTREDRLVCEIIYHYAQPATYQQVVLKIKGVVQECYSNNSCVIHTYVSRSPFVQAVIPQAQMVGRDIQLVGYFNTHTSQHLQQVTIGEGYRCDFSQGISNEFAAVEKFQQTEAEIEEQELDRGAEPLFASMSNWWHQQGLFCNVGQDIPVGEYRMQVRAEAKHGFANFFQSASSMNLRTEERYHVRIHARVDSLSSHSLYSSGGRVVIRGRGFGSSKEDISLEILSGDQGLGYELVSVADDEIVVQVQADARDAEGRVEDTQKVFFGGAGLQRKIWQNYRHSLTTFLKKPKLETEGLLEQALHLEQNFNQNNNWLFQQW